MLFRSVLLPVVDPPGVFGLVLPLPYEFPVGDAKEPRLNGLEANRVDALVVGVPVSL